MHLHQMVALVFAAVVAGCGSKNDSQGEADYAARMAQEHRADQPTASPAAQADSRAPIKSQTVRYATIDGKPINGYLAYPAAAEGGLPAVIVFHEWWGLNANIKSMTDQVAAQGYVALAADLYGGRVAEQPQAARSFMEQALQDRDAIAQNLRQAHGYLKDQIKATRIGTIGWCFGGAISLRAGVVLADQLDALIVYYGHVPDDATELKLVQAPVLGLFGGADAGIPVESVRRFEQTLRDLGKEVHIEIYEGAGHAFANPSGGNYEPAAATDAWQKSLAFLAEHLKGG